MYINVYIYVHQSRNLRKVLTAKYCQVCIDAYMIGFSEFGRMPRSMI